MNPFQRAINSLGAKVENIQPSKYIPKQALGFNPISQNINQKAIDFIVQGFTQPAGQLMQRGAQGKLGQGQNIGQDALNVLSLVPMGRLARFNKPAQTMIEQATAEFGKKLIPYLESQGVRTIRGNPEEYINNYIKPFATKKMTGNNDYDALVKLASYINAAKSGAIINPLK
jgi:hypothetical protein